MICIYFKWKKNCIKNEFVLMNANDCDSTKTHSDYFVFQNKNINKRVPFDKLNLDRMDAKLKKKTDLRNSEYTMGKWL